MAVSERASQHAARPSARPSARRQRQERRRRHVCVCARVAPRAVPSLSRQQAQPPWLPSAGARCALLPGALRASPLPASMDVIRQRSSGAWQRGHATTACTMHSSPHRLVVWIRIPGRETAFRSIQGVWQPLLLAQHRTLVSLQRTGQTPCQHARSCCDVRPAARDRRRTFDKTCWSRVSSVSSSAWRTRVSHGSALRNQPPAASSPAPLGTAHTSTAGRWRQALRRYRRCPLLCQKCPLLELCKRHGSRRVGCVAKHRIGAPSRPRTRATGSSGSLSDTSAEQSAHGLAAHCSPQHRKPRTWCVRVFVAA